MSGTEPSAVSFLFSITRILWDHFVSAIWWGVDGLIGPANVNKFLSHHLHHILEVIVVYYRGYIILPSGAGLSALTLVIDTLFSSSPVFFYFLPLLKCIVSFLSFSPSLTFIYLPFYITPHTNELPSALAIYPALDLFLSLPLGVTYS